MPRPAVDGRTYVAAYRIQPSPLSVQGQSMTFVAVGTGGSFHAGVFGIGPTPTAARDEFARALGVALRAGKRWPAGHFTALLLVPALVFTSEAVQLYRLCDLTE
ncbi:hypothetical protein ACH46G_29670 [Micromonospora aurantiaca]|uniref:hypothetical protein n=1 Tax=Micromonospora aurantiaca (nom. illeg.) TaxID=47850 RepID=UPI0033D8D4A5